MVVIRTKGLTAILDYKNLIEKVPTILLQRCIVKSQLASTVAHLEVIEIMQLQDPDLDRQP